MPTYIVTCQRAERNSSQGTTIACLISSSANSALSKVRDVMKVPAHLRLEAYPYNGEMPPRGLAPLQAEKGFFVNPDGCNSNDKHTISAQRWAEILRSSTDQRKALEAEDRKRNKAFRKSKGR